jgi:hypothetical protein
MLTNREKQLIILAYYQGGSDVFGTEFTKKVTSARIKTIKSILSELGLEYPDVDDFEKFMNELNVITEYLCKELL